MTRKDVIIPISNSKRIHFTQAAPIEITPIFTSEMEIAVQRIYDDNPDAYPGYVRILVDRLWPRGISKERAAIDYWAKDIAPSDELRKWYGHDHDLWPEFQQRYFAELDANHSGVSELIAQIGDGPVVFLFSSKERELNNAHALKAYLASRL